MSGDPLADLIAEAIWNTPPGQSEPETAAASIREWIVEQIDHERSSLRIGGLDDTVSSSYTDGGTDTLDALHDRIEEAAP